MNLRVRSEHYVKRDKYSNDLTAKLGPTAARTMPASVAVWGIKGIGKTELVMQWAYDNRHYYDTIRVFNGRTAQDLKTSIEDFYDYLNKIRDDTLTRVASSGTENDKSQSIKSWFANEKDWLVILLNASIDQGYEMTDYFPQDGSGHRIVIGDSRDLLQFARAAIEVREMTTSEAVDMLLTVSDRREMSLEQLEWAPLVVEKLGNIPLFIQITAKYILSHGDSLSQYLQLQQEQIERNTLPIPTNVRAEAFAGWQMTMTKLEEQPNSILLLNVFAFLDGLNISDTLYVMIIIDAHNR